MIVIDMSGYVVQSLHVRCGQGPGHGSPPAQDLES